MTNDNRSWFYLTLWHGTPPEFTTTFDADIVKSEKAYVSVQKKDSFETMIKKQTSAIAKIDEKEKFGIDIIRTTEVIWFVG